MLKLYQVGRFEFFVVRPAKRACRAVRKLGRKVLWALGFWRCEGCGKWHGPRVVRYEVAGCDFCYKDMERAAREAAEERNKTANLPADVIKAADGIYLWRRDITEQVRREYLEKVESPLAAAFEQLAQTAKKAVTALCCPSYVARGEAGAKGGDPDGE